MTRTEALAVVSDVLDGLVEREIERLLDYEFDAAVEDAVCDRLARWKQEQLTEIAQVMDRMARSLLH